MFFCFSTVYGGEENVQRKMQANKNYFGKPAGRPREGKWVETELFNPAIIWQITKKSS
jgi:hypothetical protein